ncbi:MAG: bifunctional biotin--[acetyl-CoA-carboxylase] ligase/biotin operon repressor BirA [Gammaproteobacteria bacterium]
MLISDKQKKLLTILADGEFHSGTVLGDCLGISRAAVWKQLSFLSDLGLRYFSVSGKGYRLNKPLDLLDDVKIVEYLGYDARALISTLEIHDQIDSTNTYLTELAHHSAPSGYVCFAERQTAGRGRRGRHWVSPYGNNIYLSLLWRFQQGPAAISGLSLAVGVAVIRALKQQSVEEVGLKWPNDIYSQGKKLGGILIEVSGENEGPCAAVIGVGLNLYLPESEAGEITQAWTDLSKVGAGTRILRNELAGKLLNHLIAVLAEFENVGMSAYLEEWRRYDCLYGKPANVFLGQHSVAGVVEGIDEKGFLLMRLADGKIQVFASGEVSFSGPSS